MKLRALFVALCLTFLFTGCSETIGDITGNRAGSTPSGGAAAVRGGNDIHESPYFKKFDFHKLSSQGTLTILHDFPTMQQNTPYSCGPVAALMVIRYFDPDTTVSEMDLCSMMGTSKLSGTTTKGMTSYFDKDKWIVESSLTDPTPHTDKEFKKFVLNHLKNNMPIIVENIDWGGHWRVIIGYDDMGKETTGNDVLIMADPYDTTDHYQDGYSVEPAQKFYYMWFDAKLFNKQERDKPWLSVKPKQ